MRFLHLILDTLFPPRQRALRARTVSYEALIPLVRPMRLASTDPPATALLPYRNPLVQAAITEAKFNDARHAQRALGSVLAEHLANTIDMSEWPCVLIPVPLSHARLHERGYNQAERICHAANIRGAIIDAKLLMRMRETLPQTKLGGRARRTNLKGAFTVARPPDPHTLYIVVDDVITTGATLSEVVNTLKTAGALHILPIALAHSP